MRFSRDFWPDIISMRLFAIPKDFASVFMQAKLAAPSAGGAPTQSLRQFPVMPVIAAFDERGCTRTRRITPSEVG
jgi:hypothetical protein